MELDQKTKKRIRWVLIIVMTAPAWLTLLAYTLAIIAGSISGLMDQGWGALPRVLFIVVIVLAFVWVLRVLVRWAKRVGSA